MILVTGATGNIGAELVGILERSGEPVRALVRNADGVPHGVTGDLNKPATLRPALEGVHGLFLLPGYQDMPGVLAEAKSAGVDRVVQLSGSSAPGGDMGNAVTRYMIESERAARSSGLAWTILQPSAFMTNALRWLPQLREGDTVRAQFPHAAAAVIDPYDIASVAALALTSEGHNQATYRLTGPAPLLPEDQVRVLGDVLGRDLEFVGLSDAETRAELEATMPPRYVDAFWSFYVDGTLDESLLTPTVAELTGRPPHTFEQWAITHADAFR
jgi:uncharacterized protein YbjT (DUF2867 family)